MPNGNPEQDVKCTHPDSKGKPCNGQVTDNKHKNERIPIGDYTGDSTKLANHIIQKVYGWKDFTRHPFYYSTHIDVEDFEDLDIERKKEILKNVREDKTTQGKMQAHHLICSESVQKEKYQEIIRFLGYSINHHKNGVLLPGVLKVACTKKVPLHYGNHDSTYVLNDATGELESFFPSTDIQQDICDVNYVEKVKIEIKDVFDNILITYKCDPKEREKLVESFINEMDNISQDIFIQVSKFNWTITVDGFDYSPLGWGCLDQITIRQKLRRISNYLDIDFDEYRTSANAFNKPVRAAYKAEGINWRDIPKNELRDYLKEVQTEINSKSEEDRDGIPRCSRKHYKNRFEIKL